jgi:hypothetical protein
MKRGSQGIAAGPVRACLLAAALLFGDGALANQERSESFGFPASTPGTLDVRVWLGGGIFVPERVYRLYEEAGRIHGQVIVWLQLHAEGETAGKPTNRQLERLMRTCCRSPRADGSLVWCEQRLDEGSLRVTLDDLQFETLFSLSDSIERKCGWAMEDGESVQIDLIRGQENHRLRIANPDFCCSEPVCAFVSHAREVVERNMSVRWGRSN